jgi:hypothetical protein
MVMNTVMVVVVMMMMIDTPSSYLFMSIDSVVRSDDDEKKNSTYQKVGKTKHHGISFSAEMTRRKFMVKWFGRAADQGPRVSRALRLDIRSYLTTYRKTRSISPISYVHRHGCIVIHWWRIEPCLRRKRNAHVVSAMARTNDYVISCRYALALGKTIRQPQSRQSFTAAMARGSLLALSRGKGCLSRYGVDTSTTLRRRGIVIVTQIFCAEWR